jgi:hypothetical protein
LQRKKQLLLGRRRGWFVGAPATFDIGNTKALTLGNTLITPNFKKVGDVNLYDVLEQKCGDSHG